MRSTTLALASVIGLGTLVGAPGAASADRIEVYSSPVHETVTVYATPHRVHTRAYHGHTHHRMARTHVEVHPRPVFTNYYTGSRQFHTWPAVTHEVYAYGAPTTRVVSHEVYRLYR